MVRRHRLLETFLATVLGVTWDEVHAEAEVLEHAVSDAARGPHRRPARPSRRSTRTATRSRPPACHVRHGAAPLDQARAGARFRVERIYDRDSAALRYLAELGVRPGVTVEVGERAPFGGPLWVSVGDRRPGSASRSPASCTAGGAVTSPLRGAGSSPAARVAGAVRRRRRSWLPCPQRRRPAARGPCRGHGGGFNGRHLPRPADVDHVANGFNPTELLRDFDYGRTSHGCRRADAARVGGLRARPGDRGRARRPVPGLDVQRRGSPGRRCAAAQGDRLRVRFVNGSAHPHTMHFHGIHPAEMDGVPGDRRAG